MRQICIRKTGLLAIYLSVCLLVVVATASAQSSDVGDMTPNQGEPAVVIMQLHHDRPETFLVRDEGDTQLAGELPVTLGYEGDFSKLEGQDLAVIPERVHGGRTIKATWSPGTEAFEVESGSFLITSVTGSAPAAVLEGTFQLSLSNGETVEGSFKIPATFRSYELTSMGWIFMLLSIAGVWILAIYCYKKLLFDSEE